MVEHDCVYLNLKLLYHMEGYLGEAAGALRHHSN